MSNPSSTPLTMSQREAEEIRRGKPHEKKCWFCSMPFTITAEDLKKGKVCCNHSRGCGQVYTIEIRKTRSRRR